MRNSVRLIIGFLLANFLVSSLPQVASAGDLGSIVRLDRTAVSKTTGGTICATPETNAVEDALQIAFPPGFTVNQTASNWTVSTSDLPNGTSALPGIGTATQVSGQTVTFPSNNLSVGTTYCFHFASNSTVTTPSSTGSFAGTLRTLTSSNSVIDSRGFAISIVSNDQISVTATVPANPTDFQAKLELINPSNNSYITEGTMLTYKLSYGSSLSQPADITVEAQWNPGTIQGSSTPTENLLDYVSGSATNGYGGAIPVVDIANNKIDWQITAFPGGLSDQPVVFKLAINNNSGAILPVTFTVDGRVLGPGTQTPDSTITSTYQKSRYITPTPTIPCTPSNCPTATPAPTGTPTPTLPPTPKPVIKTVDIRSISTTDSTVYVTTQSPSTIRIDIGTDFKTLRSLGFSKTPSTQHLINLKGLSPNTRYYFRIIATDREATTTSDFYLLTTASTSSPFVLAPQTLIITSGDVVLADSSQSSGSAIILPQQTSFSFKFGFKNYQNIKSVVALTRNSNVLGISTVEAASPTTGSVPVTEIAPGQYVGKLMPKIVGNYSLILRVSDFNGNLSEEKIAFLRSVPPLQIIEKGTKSGIENAKVTIWIYNQRRRLYELPSFTVSPIRNPAFTDSDGYISTVLPPGKYRAEVVAIGYDSNTTEFTVGSKEANYPIVELKKQPFNVGNYTNYYLSSAKDALSIFQNYIDTVKSSGRFLELLTLGVIVLFIFLGLLQISRVYGVSLVFLPAFALYHLVSLVHKPKYDYFIQGKVVDIVSQNTPIEGVLLHFAKSNGKVFAHTRTNTNGEFAVPVSHASNVKIIVSKKRYQTYSKVIAKEELANKLIITITRSSKPEKFGFDTIAWYFESIAESLFESFLVLTIILEIVFAQQFGVVKVLPCLVVSLLNFFLWALHARNWRNG